MNIVNLPDIILESNPAIENNPVIFYHHSSEHTEHRSMFSFNMHCMVFMINGKKHIRVGEEDFCYDSSSCLLFKTGNYLSTELSSEDESYQSLLLFFNTKSLDRMIKKHQQLLNKNRHSVESKNYLSIDCDAFMGDFKKALLTLFKNGQPISKALAEVKFEEIILYIFERHGRLLVDFYKQKIDQKTMNFFKRVVEANIHSNTSIEEIAFLCHMSKSTFKRVFTKVYGESPGRWLREKRLDRSAFLLDVKKIPPNEVYLQVGFSNFSSFIQSFKKKFGVTPKQYQLSSS